MIYLAAPYWHEDPVIRETRVAALCEFHNLLLQSETRSFFYNPLANSQGVTVANESYWRIHGLHVLGLCDALYVYMLPGWEDSKGVHKEITFANKHNIPVHYHTPSGKHF